ncbi:MAG: hypothetical protein HC858_11335, partial [Brachymonas sp.]|nr:hypothetical protein [Brachymonas sp.]
MDFPSLKPGQHYTLPRPVSSSDALMLSQFATEQKLKGKITAIICADAQDAQRLQDEIAFFQPGLRGVMFPGLGNFALRHVLAASGFDLGAA